MTDKVNQFGITAPLAIMATVVLLVVIGVIAYYSLNTAGTGVDLQRKVSFAPKTPAPLSESDELETLEAELVETDFDDDKFNEELNTLDAEFGEELDEIESELNYQL